MDRFPTFAQTTSALQTRVLSSAPSQHLQLLTGIPAPTATTSYQMALEPAVLLQRHQQLEIRLSSLCSATARCRSEVNLTLRLLRAVTDAEASLSQVTIYLGRAQRHLDLLDSRTGPSRQEAVQATRADLDEQMTRAHLLVNTHVPSLEQLATKFSIFSGSIFHFYLPSLLITLILTAPRARQRIQPIVSRLHDSLGHLRRLYDELRVRSEQHIRLARPPISFSGLPSAKISRRHISPRAYPSYKQDEDEQPDLAPSTMAPQRATSERPLSARPPRIVKPLQNQVIIEGKRIVMETVFDSGLPGEEIFAKRKRFHCFINYLQRKVSFQLISCYILC
ncbi:unnamed protein product [Protopolystoma xenopodis]|uniref:Uncharacterized protein n=1 Tax=Protopolystoma xenopodis TaxID=117903 RepID=A0A448XDI1_9PLAT|nr:unnamed protein product [Protopolystoma xenopodis]